MEAQDSRVRKAVTGLPRGLHEPIARSYFLYPMIDAAVFPLMDSGGVADLTTMHVVRISPHDAKALSNNPWRLESRGMGAFAGFLRKEAREHDLLWGRLDAAERLIDQIIAAAVGDKKDGAITALRDQALTKAIKAILRESEAGASPKVCKLLADLRTRLSL